MWSSDSSNSLLLPAGISLVVILLALGALPAQAEDVLIFTARAGVIQTLSRTEVEQLYLGRRTTFATHITMLVDLPPGRTGIISIAS